MASGYKLRLGDGTTGPRVLSWLGLVATVIVLWRWLSDPTSVRGSLADA